MPVLSLDIWCLIAGAMAAAVILAIFGAAYIRTINRLYALLRGQYSAEFAAAGAERDHAHRGSGRARKACDQRGAVRQVL